MAKEELRYDGAATLIDVTADWLMSQALADGDMESLVEGCCKRLVAAGIPLVRMYLAFRTLHPLFRAVGLTWSREAGMNTVGYLHSEPASNADPQAGASSPTSVSRNTLLPPPAGPTTA